MPPRGPTPRQNSQPRLMRPRTSPGIMSRRGGGPGLVASVEWALNPEDRAIPEEEEEGEEEQIELLEYEWPDLPPIPCMKDAVSRKRVSQGISYLLPVDKGKNSINNWFRTDLRAMFQEPYASDDLQYDDNRVKLSAGVHFLSNTADTKWTNQHLTSIQPHLNADSEKARKLYVHSAPTGGVASRRMGIDPTKLRKRSNLFLPVKATKAQVSEDILKLREEATQIMRQGMQYNDDGDVASNQGNDERGAKNSNNNTITINNNNKNDSNNLMNSTNSFQNSLTNHNHYHNHPRHHHYNKQNNDPNNNNNKIINNTTTTITKHPKEGENQLLTTFGGSVLLGSLGTSALNAKLQNLNLQPPQPEKFSNYEELRNATPPKAIIPQELSSPFLEPDQNQRVWEWLHYGEAMNDFEYFLSVCG